MMIDHLVYTVPDLEVAVDQLETTLGVRPLPGGHHATQGTQNALVRLDQGVYLEILAADDDNAAIAPPRWMGVDLLTGPKITRWALKSDDLPAAQRILRDYDSRLGEIEAGSRITTNGDLLQWSMILPLPSPEVDIVPFFIDWSATEVLPYDALPDMGCRLVQLFATHPEPASLAPLYTELGVTIPVIEAPEASLKAVLQCPAGIIQL